MPYVPEPIIFEQTARGEYRYDIWSRLMKDNVLFIGTQIDDYVANLVSAQMLYLESQNPEKDISIYINSPGGSVTAGLAILDTMQYVKPDISTICIGQAASMAAVLMAVGKKGKRYALPNSRILLHQPLLYGLSGQASDIDIHAKDILRLREKLNQILADASGQPVEKIQRDTDRDFILEADKAVEYGVIDAVITRRDDAPGGASGPQPVAR